ncbi:MAG TPA: response regulator [Steroidobacteraceae bacterium]|nr:response regulator [Steroidobacteraceae bacterium]
MTQTSHQILIVEDDRAIREVLHTLLTQEGYGVIEAETAERGEIEARSHKPDLLLLDLGLPDNDGLSVVRHVRAWSSLPIIVLSARTLEEQKIASLDAGADDYVTKPFSAAELLARVRAGLRRNARGSEQSSVLQFGTVRIDLPGRRAYGPQGEIHLTTLEYRLLECLARHTGIVVRQQQLLRQVWGPDRVSDARGLRVCIKNLRDKLEPVPQRPRYILTEIGIGYRLCIEESR